MIRGAMTPLILHDHGRVVFTRVGSGCNSTPNRSATPSRMWPARASRAAVVPVPRLVRARVCLVDTPTPAAPGYPYPLPNPARSISQAALTLTVPSGLGHAAGSRSPARDRSSAYPPADRTGLVKNEPAEYVSGSAGSSTM